jgi:RNase adaptor protein for sRNA GlmZ degradation
MKQLKHKDLISRWSMNRRFRPLMMKNHIKKLDEIRKEKGQPTSVQQRGKQFLIFALTQVGAFERLEKRLRGEEVDKSN